MADREEGLPLDVHSSIRVHHYSSMGESAYYDDATGELGKRSWNETRLCKG